MKNKCPYCTDGKVEVLFNYADFHFHGDYPIIEIEGCEECGGTGYEQGIEESEEEQVG